MIFLIFSLSILSISFDNDLSISIFSFLSFMQVKVFIATSFSSTLVIIGVINSIGNSTMVIASVVKGSPVFI